MSASNFNWVCFPCHFAFRQAKTARRIPKCAVCGADCYNLGYKVEIPKKDDSKAWRKLRDECRKRALAWIRYEAVSQTRRLHDIEKEISHLESLGPNKDRARRIVALKKQQAQT